MGVYSGNRTLLGESTYNADEPTHIMEMVLECERNDLRMFEAVINCDFIEAYNEAGIISINEDGENEAKNETKKGVVQKIKELFKRAIEAVKRFVASAIAKIKNMFANDAKLYKTYIENFDKNAVGYQMSAWRTLESDVDNASRDVLSRGMSAIQKDIANLDKASSNDEITKYVENTKKYLKGEDIAKEVDELFFGDKKETYKLTSTDVGIIKEVVKNSNRAISSVKAHGKHVINMLQNKQSELKADRTMADDKDELALAKLNAKYKIAGMTIKYTNKALNAVYNAYARYLAQCRRAFVLAGKKASAKEEQKNDQTVNASYDFMLGEASNDFVERMLLAD